MMWVRHNAGLLLVLSLSVCVSVTPPHMDHAGAGSVHTTGQDGPQFRTPRWGSPATRSTGEGEAANVSPGLGREGDAEGAQEGGAGGALDAAWIRFVTPGPRQVITAAPFLIRMEANGFSVPEDGEVMLTMTYEGRGSQVRVLQSLEFMCWNVVSGPVRIEAQLVTTKDQPVGEPAVLEATQQLETFFAVSAPEDGQLLFASDMIRVNFLLNGLDASHSDLLAAGSVCAHTSCISQHDTAEERVCSGGGGGVGLQVEGGSYVLRVPAKAGNCTLTVSVTDAGGVAVAWPERRSFRVVDEQRECPAGSGVACLHGSCQETEDGLTGVCVCDPGYHGRRCAAKEAEGEGEVGLDAKYLSLVKNALLDTLYAKDRPGETAVVARSMVGRKGLDDLEQMVRDVIQRDVPGDLMETGVWQGGSCILMKAVLHAAGDKEKKVWVVDSFEGCPKPNEGEFPQDAGDRHHTFTNLMVPLAKVQSNFEDFGLLDERVEFVRGWFEDSMQSERVQSVDALALLRLDGDLYQSTYEVLRGVYFKVSVGGLVVVDDWRLDGMQARSAVIDFHRECRLSEKIHVGSDGLAWWRKESVGECG